MYKPDSNPENEHLVRVYSFEALGFSRSFSLILASGYMSMYRFLKFN
jgi:hypothetical protein